MGIQNLKSAIKTAVQNRVDEESRAVRGIINKGQFVSGSRAYPFTQAVDCDTSDGARVWAQISKNGTAVIVGA